MRPVGTHSAPGLLLASLAQPLTTAAAALQPAITPTEEHMQAISLMETLSIAATQDDFYTIQTASLINTVDYADKCLHVCLARTPPATPAIRLSRYVRVNIDFLKAGTMELKFVLAHLRLTTSQ